MAQKRDQGLPVDVAGEAAGDRGAGGLGCAAVSDRRNGSGAGSRAGSLSASRHRTTWCVVASPAVGVSTPQAFRDWDALCAAEGLTAEASAGKLNELSRAYASAFAGAISGGQQGQAPPVSFPWGRTWPDLKSPRLSAPGSRAGLRTTSNVSSSASILPLQKSSVILAAAGTPEAALHASLSGSGSALFGLYSDPRRCRSGLRPAASVRVCGAYLTRTLPRPVLGPDASAKVS